MSWFYRHCLRPVLFSFGSEEIHDHTMSLLGRASTSSTVCEALHALYGAPEMPVELFGLRFPNPVGLAAGMDKQAAAVPVWEALGFGHAELGGVTWHAQPGNEKPRMFRAVDDGALVNRMGFNNHGAQALAARLAGWKSAGRWPKHPVGINLGKSKITPLDKAAEDYAHSFRTLRGLADFFVVNVSSPNTPGLRQLQDKTALEEILSALQEAKSSTESPASPKPILIKVAPDLTFDALDEIVTLAKDRKVSGIVATNTTIARPETTSAPSRRSYGETGGLSGRPLRTRSTEVIRHLHRQTGGTLPIIGVGGIFDAADAWEKITAGASLVQIYSGMVYEGPSIAGEIVRGLMQRMTDDGVRSLSEVVGTGC